MIPIPAPQTRDVLLTEAAILETIQNRKRPECSTTPASKFAVAELATPTALHRKGGERMANDNRWSNNEQEDAFTVTPEDLAKWDADMLRREQAKARLLALFGEIKTEYNDSLQHLEGDYGDGELASLLLETVEESISDVDWLDFLADILSWTVKDVKAGPNGFVYILKSGKYVKIGRTARLDTRIKTLRIQLPFPVEVVNAFPCEDAVKAEQYLHDFFGRHRANGEWFEIPENIIYGWLKQTTHMTADHCEYTNDLASHHERIPTALYNDERWGPAFRQAKVIVEAG